MAPVALGGGARPGLADAWACGRRWRVCHVSGCCSSTAGFYSRGCSPKTRLMGALTLSLPNSESRARRVRFSFFFLVRHPSALSVALLGPEVKLAQHPTVPVPENLHPPLPVHGQSWDALRSWGPVPCPEVTPAPSPRLLPGRGFPEGATCPLRTPLSFQPVPRASRPLPHAAATVPSSLRPVSLPSPT